MREDCFVPVEDFKNAPRVEIALATTAEIMASLFNMPESEVEKILAEKDNLEYGSGKKVEK